MRVVISGYYGYDNVGDEAILFSIIQALRKQDPSISVTVLSNNPESTAKSYDVQAVNRWKLKDIYQALSVADGFISGGGSLLQDKTSGRTIPYYTTIIQIAKRLKVPTFIYAQGMGPIEKRVGRFLTKAALKNTLLTVRDQESKQLLEEIGLTQEIKLVPDPVLGIEIGEIAEDDVENRKKISVSVRDWKTDIPFLEHIAKGLDSLANKGYEIDFIPMHGEHDAATSRFVMDLMEQKATIAPADLSIEGKIKRIGVSDVLLGMRLHALIFAAVTNTPYVPVSYDPKIDSFARISGYAVAIDVHQPDWNDRIIVEEVEKLFADLTSSKQFLASNIDEQIWSAQHTAKLALEYFNK
ncbi:polysaccharide pyruvyl transferase CsaB [Mangrovibacillus cuniculi]|uniref:Polysaccharide pyruvyl transferase CsaB n=1 Tax=Mangrovibacillus cuniculi TaxID=2593652 RepID=A0A7S8HG53_9BACI|nr:polysaccharide pyruvyl transferase CsaB [Mangrovibacillus cuniculi]QPC47528.1 polysaccharide pyruvyl transferase CsaB [Mangrovibacillus cuniculi]